MPDQQQNLAIKIENLNKEFLIPHRKITTLKETFLSFLKPKTYEKFSAVKNLQLELNHGEFLGILGPNGSGKSTLLKLIAGIYKPTSGKININGTIAPFLELGIGFQEELTARENISINATLLGLNRNHLKARFSHIVEFSGIGNFLDLKIKNYSSGMKARLAFAIAKEADADIYLCDEILAVGDAEFQQKCISTFESWKSAGKTILFVSHNPDLIQKFCNRAIIVHGGSIIFEGTPTETVKKYQEGYF